MRYFGVHHRTADIILHGTLQANQNIAPDLKSLKKVIISHLAPDDLRGVYLLPNLHRDRRDKAQQLSGQNLLTLPPDTIKAGQPLPLLLTAFYQGQAVEATMIAHYQATPPITALAGTSSASLNLSIWVLGLLALLAGLIDEFNALRVARFIAEITAHQQNTDKR